MIPQGTSLTPLEKAAIITTGAGAASKILLWQVGATVTTAGPAVWGVDALALVRVAFALLSFVAFDLVLYALVVDARARGWCWSGLTAAAVAALVSALIALEVAEAGLPRALAAALHAAPMAVLFAFVVHLMLGRAAPAAAAAAQVAPQASATAAVAVTIGLPRTVGEFIAVRAAELPGQTVPRLAAELGTSADTVRRALAREGGEL